MAAGFISTKTGKIIPVGRYDKAELELINILVINGELSIEDYRKYRQNEHIEVETIL